MTTEPDQKGKEVKQNADITAKDEEVAEIRRSEKDKEPQEPQEPQGQYIEKMLKTFGQTEEKPVSTPVVLNVKPQKEDGVSRPVDIITN